MKLRVLIPCLLLFSGTANAAVTLEFLQPDGIVGAQDSIEVWVRLSTDSDFNFDGTDLVTFGGLDSSLIPIEAFSPDANGGAGGFVEFDNINSASTNTSFSCSGSFAGDDGSPCPPGQNYDFEFGLDTLFNLDSFFLAGGDSLDFLFGTFVPVAPSGAAPGTYDFFGASFILIFDGEGTDDLGDTQSLTAFVTVARTCTTGDTSCDFTRTVVPVPAAVWLFLSAIGGLAGTSRKRRD